MYARRRQQPQRHRAHRGRTEKTKIQLEAYGINGYGAGRTGKETFALTISMSTSMSRDRQMGQAAASVIAAEIRRAIQERGRAVVILASAPSQNEFLANLAAAPDIDWSRVTAFHLDEYLGMDDQAPQSFRRFLIDRLVNKVPLGQFHGLRGDAPDGTAEAKRYAELLRAESS